MKKLFVPAILCGLLLACSKEIPLPPVTAPMTAEQLQPLLYTRAGRPYAIGRIAGEVKGPDDRLLSYRLVYPRAPESRVPVIIFSHGNWSDVDQYQVLVDYWASHGYLVASVNHLDCCGMANGIWQSLVHGQVGLIEGRIQDLRWLMDSSDFIRAQLPELADQLDFSRFALAGHSFGAFSAQQLSGAAYFDPDAERYVQTVDERVAVVVAISPPGPMFDVITENSWRDLSGPHLLTTGTWDVNARFWPDWRMHKMAFDTARPGQNMALVTQGVDHYYGNLICRLEREQVPQTEGMMLLLSTSLAFMDAHMHDDAMAIAWLQQQALAEQTAGFVVLESR